MLAVLPQAPSRLRPDRWPERAEAARNKVLERMAEQGVWSRKQVKESREEPIWLAPRQMPQLAPLFSRMMLGKSKSDKIVTTLDLRSSTTSGRTGAKLERTFTTAQLTGDDRG